jgi:tetratricopeptide (TPR) repeat protein
MRNAIPRLFVFVLVALIFQPRPSRADYKQAVAYYSQGKYDKAIQELKPDLDQNPDWEPGHRIVGLSYLRLGNNSLAASELSQAVKLKSPVFSTYYGLGLAYFNMQKYDSCITTLSQGESFAVKEKDPEKEKGNLYELRAKAYYKLSKFNEAISDLTNAIRAGQSDWSDYFTLGAAYLSSDRVDEGIQALEKSLSLKAGQNETISLLSKAYLNKGVSSLTEKQYGPAIQFLSKARDYDPKNANIHYRLGEAYLLEKKYPDAEKSLSQAIDLQPNNSDAYTRIGTVYENQKKWDLALDAYKKADQINPSKVLKDSIQRVTENKKIPDQKTPAQKPKTR